MTENVGNLSASIEAMIDPQEPDSLAGRVQSALELAVEDAWTSQTYADAFRSGESVRLPEDSGLRGRIIRGRTPEEFEQLSSDGRRLVFIMGPDGLTKLPGKPLLKALDTIGLRPEYVQGRIAQGYSFQFVVFEGGQDAPLATWDNVLDVVSNQYPELSEDIAAHREELKSRPFDFFAEQMAPHELDQIDLAGPEHPLYMSLERYLVIAKEQRQQDLLYLRRVLLHEVHLGPLYAGDGYTTMPDGTRGMQEYIAPNGPVAALEKPVVIGLSPDKK